MRVRISKIGSSRGSGTDHRPRQIPIPIPEGELVCYVRWIFKDGRFAAQTRPPEGNSGRARATDAVRAGRPLCVVHDDESCTWTSPATSVEHDSRGLPREVITQSGSIYRVTFLERVTLQGIGAA